MNVINFKDVDLTRNVALAKLVSMENVLLHVSAELMLFVMSLTIKPPVNVHQDIQETVKVDVILRRIRAIPIHVEVSFRFTFITRNVYNMHRKKESNWKFEKLKI